MGRARRPVPAKLAGKLRAIRRALDLTQAQMHERLGDTGTALYVGHVGEYETGKREPPIFVLLAYSRVAGVPMEVLADDKMALPERLPSVAGYEWIMRQVSAQ